MPGDPHGPQRDELERELRRRQLDLERSPADPGINLEIGQLLYQLGRYSEALAHLQKVTAAEPKDASAWHQVGYAAFYSGRFDLAEEAFRQEIDLGRDDAASRGALAATLRQLQQPQAALELGQEALASSPDPALRQRLHRMIGTWMEESGDLEGALVHLQQAVEANPEDAVAQYNLGLVFVCRGQYGAALAHLRIASRVEPEDADIWALLGEAARLSGALRTGRQALEKAIALRAGVSEWEAELALVLHRLGQPKGAIEYAHRALQHALDAKSRSSAHTVLAHAHSTLGDDEAELRHREEAVRAAPDLAVGHHNLGVIYYRQRRLADAIRCLKQATTLAPEDADAWYALGLAARDAGEYALAQEALQRAVALGEDEMETQREVLRMLLAQEKWAEVTDYSRQMLEATADPEWQVWLYCRLADAAEAEGRTAEVLPFLETAQRLDAPGAPAHFNLACAYHQRERIEEALAEVRRAVALAPRDPEFQVFLGQLLVEHEADEEAEQVLRGLLGGPQRELASLNLVILLTDQGRNGEALELAQTQLSADKDSAKAWAALSLVYRKTGDTRKAMEALEMARRLDPDDPWVASIAADLEESNV
jgi:tetratricopeptide (TPR) repeat protein